MFDRCPRQWMYRYVQGRKLRPAGALIVGGSYHAALEMWGTKKLETGKDLDADTLADKYIDEFDRRAGEEDVDWEGESPVAERDRGVRLVRAHRRQRATSLKPVWVEADVPVDILDADGQSLGRLVQRLDFYGVDGVVRDFKTSSKKPGAAEVEQSNQLTSYYGATKLHLAAQGIQADPPVALEVAVDYKTRPAEVYVAQARRTEEDWREWLEHVAAIYRMIRADIFPRNTEGWHCSPQKCGYFHLCRPHRILSIPAARVAG